MIETSKPIKLTSVKSHAVLNGKSLVLTHGGEEFGRMRDTITSSIICYDKKFVNWFSIGVPVSEAHQSAASVPTEERAVRILHSPSKPLIKGSAFITGKQELYVSKNDPFPEGYRLNDTWPDF